MTAKKIDGRKGRSGRKPVTDKKVTLCIYPQQSRIEAIGMERCKFLAFSAIEKEYKKINKKV